MGRHFGQTARLGRVLVSAFRHPSGLWLAVLLATGCRAQSGEPEPLASELVSGLSLLGGDFVHRDDHLVEVVVHGDYAYTANSNRGYGVMRLDANGEVVTTDRGYEYEAGVRCTTLAVHAASDTLYCASDEPTNYVYSVEIFDLAASPESPQWRSSFALDAPTRVRDLEVIGERLVINTFDGGIESAQISASGELSARVDAGVSGNARFSVGVGTRIVSLFADDSPTGHGAELRLYDVSEASAWQELDRLPLAGPPLGLSADAKGGERAAVALGSGGLSIVSSRGDALAVERHFDPPAVTTAPLLAGDLVYAITLSGLFGYALEGEDVRLFGFGPSAPLGSARSGNMLHGAFYGDEIVTSDWLWVERWAADPSGDALELDVPRGIYLPPDGPVRWRMRNPGAQPLRVELWHDRKVIWVGEVAPASELTVELPSPLREVILNPVERRAVISVRVHDPRVPSTGEPVSSTAIVIAERPGDDDIPPALGDTFPTLTLATLEREVYTLPTPGGSQTIWFWPDCAMMWPQLEDLAWLEREGIDLGRGVPVMLADFDIGTDGFDRRWALAGATFGMWGPGAPEVGDANDYIDDFDIYEPLWIEEIPGDAMPTDYVMDEQGVIRSIERMYRGPWTLVEPYPWD